MYYMETHIQRFKSFYKQVGDCYIWQNYLDKDGYGSFYFMKKARRAHRVSYYFKNGSIPKGMVIDHICRNRACVNPDHLRCVTIKENNLSNSMSVGYLNSIKTHCKYGHPLDRKYGKQRYCSVCSSEKTKRLRSKWKDEANLILC